MKIVPVILAGGIGERFWPLSRSSRPKQLLRLVTNHTMVEDTITRIVPLLNRDVKPLLVTSKTIAAQIRNSVPKSIKYDQIIEPVGKNTAPAVAIAASWIEAKYGECVMVVLSADHSVAPRTSFISAVKHAAKLAEEMNKLVVFGVKPNRPETGYGYIQLGKKVDGDGENVSHVVKRFIEKPNQTKAVQLVKSGTHMWNSGMFVWKTSAILSELKAYMPELFKLTSAVSKSKFTKPAIDKFYKLSPKESIDYGIMEKSSQVAAVIGSFTWDDIGSWESLCRIHGKNKSDTTVVGDTIYESDCKNSIIVNKSAFTLASVGLDNIAVIATDDALLVIDRSRLPDLKKYLGEMKKSKLPKNLF